MIIAGAGPVGLFLACELRLAKLSVLVLEQLEDPHSPLKRLPFGMRGLWGPSIEAFYRRGLLEQIASQPRADDVPRPAETWIDGVRITAPRAGRPLRGHPVRLQQHRFVAVDVPTPGPGRHPIGDRDGASRARPRRSRTLRRRRDPARPWCRRLRDFER